MKDPVRERGLHAYSSGRCRVIELDWVCRPDRDAAWAAREKRKLGPVAFNREFGRSFDTPAGQPFYELFASDPTKYLRTVKQLINGPVHRGWDLGGSHPALVTGQWSPNEGRLWYYREVGNARKILLHDFRDLGRFLCGEIPFEDLVKNGRRGAIEWVEREQRRGIYGVPIPWFPPGTQFVDFCGHEMLRTQSITGKTEADVFAEVGIWIQRPAAHMLHDHERIMRFLQGMHPDGKAPRMLVDPACTELVRALSGGLSYAPKKPKPEPYKDGHFDDLHDAAKYLAAGVSPILSVEAMERLRRSAPSQPTSPQVEPDEMPEDLPSIPWGTALQGLRWDR